MATNNVLFKNAALAGACSALLNGRDSNEAAGSTSLDDIAAAIATAVDAEIPLDETATASEANLINQITAGLCAGRSFVSATAADYAGIAVAIAAVYASVKAKLE